MTDLIKLALKCGAFQNDGDHGIPAGTLITFEPDELQVFVEEAVKLERERCAYLAQNACLVLPDGGSPTEDERLVCEEAARRIRARSTLSKDVG